MKELSVGNQEIPCAHTERQNDRSHPESPDLSKFTETEQKNTGHESCLTEKIGIKTFHNKN
jgi:hypothetical protein